MNTSYAVYYVSAETTEYLVGIFDSREKAEKVAHSIAGEDNMLRYNKNLWMNADSWSTVYIKEYPLNQLLHSRKA